MKQSVINILIVCAIILLLVLIFIYTKKRSDNSAVIENTTTTPSESSTNSTDTNSPSILEPSPEQSVSPEASPINGQTPPVIKAPTPKSSVGY